VSTRDGLVVGRGVPALVLRVAIFVVGLAIVLVPLQEGTTIGTFIVLVPAVLASVYSPASPAPAAVVIVAALLLALTDGDPLRVQVLALIPLVHLFHVTCGIAGVLPVAGRLHLRALRAPALRFVLVQVVVFALAGLAALLPSGRVPVPFEIVGLAGLAGIGLLLLWLQRVR